MRSEFAIEVELGPEVNVSPATSQTITDAFGEAGLAFQWVPLRGDRSKMVGAQASAEPSLQVRLRAHSDVTTAEMIAAIHPRLSTAIAMLRRRLPGLPLGIETVSALGRRRFFAFGRADSAEAIVAGMTELVHAASSGAEVLGWDANAKEWREF